MHRHHKCVVPILQLAFDLSLKPGTPRSCVCVRPIQRNLHLFAGRLHRWVCGQQVGARRLGEMQHVNHDDDCFYEQASSRTL